MATPDWLMRHMRPCVIHKRVDAGLDEYGNPMYGDLAVDASCFIQPLSQVETMDGRAEVATFLVHFPSEVAGNLDGFSWLEVDGQPYEADEPPATYPSFSTTNHHVELAVRKGTA